MSALIDLETCRAIRKALIIGLSSFGEIERLGNAYSIHTGIACEAIPDPDFDSGMRRFESFLPSQNSRMRAGESPARIVCESGIVHEARMAYDSLMVFTGNANPKLAADVVRRLNISLGRATVGRFSDGEVNARSWRTSAARTASSCNRPARRPTTT
jgi:hypothetical protein